MNTASEKLQSRVAASAAVDTSYQGEGNLGTDELRSTGQEKAAMKVCQPEIRWDLVQRVKAEIAAGTFETPERIERTLERLAEELFDL
jgi:anti-sigma28 factor (negative regulator of flagellin synthesis)